MRRFKARIRAFAIWQKLGYFPWKKTREVSKKTSGDFYKGAIPFLNEDAKRTFRHLLLRPGYMIRDYINGAHEQYLAPLTALIVFYAFFALIWAVMQPVQREEASISDAIKIELDEDLPNVSDQFIQNMILIYRKGVTYLTLDKHPDEVHTRGEAALAALEGTLRSQGIPLFIGQFFLLWLAMSIALRHYKPGMSATAAASAYILCQFSFFMLFAVLLTFGESKSVSAVVLLALLTIDLHQWLGVSWQRGLRLGVRTGILYGLLMLAFILCVSTALMAGAWLKGT